MFWLENLVRNPVKLRYTPNGERFYSASSCLLHCQIY